MVRKGHAPRGLLAAWAVGVPYRPAWSPERALGLLREESHAAFDPRCVTALERVLERTQDDPGWVATFATAAEPVAARAPTR
jgi:response regulator RpfG family c-di-GMP phosphodiesterase